LVHQRIDRQKPPATYQYLETKQKNFWSKYDENNFGRGPLAPAGKCILESKNEKLEK